MLIGLHVQIHTQYGERGRLEIDQLFEQLCGSGFTGERILGVDWFSGSRHGFGQLTRLLQHAECQTGTQLTKSAPLGGDSETRTLKGPGEATWASRRAALAKLERAAFPQHWPFPASPCRRAVNQKDKEFVVGLFGSANRTRTESLLVNSHFSAFCSAHRVSIALPVASRIDLLVSAHRAMERSPRFSRTERAGICTGRAIAHVFNFHRRRKDKGGLIPTRTAAPSIRALAANIGVIIDCGAG